MLLGPQASPERKQGGRKAAFFVGAVVLRGGGHLEGNRGDALASERDGRGRNPSMDPTARKRSSRALASMPLGKRAWNCLALRQCGSQAGQRANEHDMRRSLLSKVETIGVRRRTTRAAGEPGLSISDAGRSTGSREGFRSLPRGWPRLASRRRFLMSNRRQPC